MTPEHPTPTVEEHRPAVADDTVQDEPTREHEEAAPSPEVAEAPAAEAAPSPLMEQEQAGRTQPRVRDRAESARGPAPPAEYVDAQATLPRKRPAGAIWRQEAPSVPEGLRVGPSTPLPVADRAPVAPAVEVATAARDNVSEREVRQRPEGAPVDGIEIERAAIPQRKMEEAKTKAALASELQRTVGKDVLLKRTVVSREAGRARPSVAAPGAPAEAEGATSRRYLRGKRDDERLSFTVTGVGEKQVLAILAAGRQGDEKKRVKEVGAVRAMSAQRAELTVSDATMHPVVTHLADGRISILTTVRSTDLPGILAALGKEGTVRPARTQLMQGRDDGLVLLELVLVP